MDSKFYLSDFQGRSDASSIIIAAADQVRLPSNPCKFAFLSRWNVTNNEAFTALLAPGVVAEDGNIEVYYGFNNIIVDQLFPGRRTELLPVNNTDQIVIRNPKVGAAVAIYYAWFY